jgi:Brp/Blh family beta-carotene 15,15'-monooxygenase
MPLFHKGVITISSLLIYFLIGGTNFELVFAFALILIVGIPHGSTDLLLSKHIEGSKMREWPFWKFIITYLSVMMVYAALWYFFRGTAFVIFLTISAYHFGEAQLVSPKKKRAITPVVYLLWGYCALMILFIPHLAETKMLIVPYLIDPGLFEAFQANTLYILGALGLPLLLLLLLNSPDLFVKECIEMIMLFIISSYTSLLVGFAVFFAFWHSYDSASFQLLKLSKIKKGFNFRAWLKKAAPYTIISWVGIVIILLLAVRLDLSWPIITLFFVLVSLITLPHVIIMSRFYSKTER